MSKIIMGIQLKDRHEKAKDLQDILTQYGCYIKTRLGVHNASKNACSEKGLIILEFIDDAGDKARELEKEINDLGSVVIKKMEF